MGERRAAWLRMRKYKVCVLREDGYVISRVNLFCDGVEQAKEWAKGLVDANPIELWEGSTRIERFDPDALRGSPVKR
jgi:hypothetical protein